MRQIIRQYAKNYKGLLSFIVFCTFIFTLPVSLAQADPINFIAVKTHLSLEGQEVVFKTETASYLPYPTEDAAERLAFTAEYFDANFLIENKGSKCHISINDVTLDASGTVIQGAFQCSGDITDFADLKVESGLFLDLFQDVNHFLVISLQGQEREALFTTQNRVLFGSTLTKNDQQDSSKRSSGGLFATIKQFVGLGVPHVLLGFDHVLFILAIHLIVRKWKDIFIVVTSFTIAHSITLILASLGFITVTSRVVEPFIAFTIVYTAVRNIIIMKQQRTEEQVLKERWVSAFGFGLIHGLGFAGALAAIEIPKAYFIPALLAFNVGVEIGQLIVIALFVSFLLFIKKRGWLLEVVYGLSGAITVIASIWMIQRIFLV